MMSLFYVLSTLLMAAAHYTLCDETSVVEASTAVSLWGDLAAGWLLANHKPLAGLVLIGTIVFAMWVVVSIVALYDATDRVMKEIAVQIVSTTVEDIVKGVVNEIEDERVTREVNRFTAMARIEINLEKSDNVIAEINQRLKTIEDAIAAEKAAAEAEIVLYTYPAYMQRSCNAIAHPPLIPNVDNAPVIALASPAETGMSPTGPYHSGSILVDTSMRPYVAGVNRDWQKRVAAAEIFSDEARARFEANETMEAEIEATKKLARQNNAKRAQGIIASKRKSEGIDLSDRPTSHPRNA